MTTPGIFTVFAAIFQKFSKQTRTYLYEFFIAFGLLAGLAVMIFANEKAWLIGHVPARGYSYLLFIIGLLGSLARSNILVTIEDALNVDTSTKTAVAEKAAVLSTDVEKVDGVLQTVVPTVEAAVAPVVASAPAPVAAVVNTVEATANAVAPIAETVTQDVATVVADASPAATVDPSQGAAQ